MTKAPRLRRYFFVGLIVIAPVTVTVVVLRWIFETIDAILGRPLQAAIGFRIPGLGFILLGLLVLAVGWVVHNAVGRRLLSWWNDTVGRFPVIGRLYNAASQIVQAVVGDQKRVFKRVVLVPFPSDSLWSVGFVTSEDSGDLGRYAGAPTCNVFVPTTPNPTTGFLLVVPKDRLRETTMSIEDAVKTIISAGSVTHDDDAGAVPRRGLNLEDLFRDSHR
jgi:uncharacterized membrane protein